MIHFAFYFSIYSHIIVHDVFDTNNIEFFEYVHPFKKPWINILYIILCMNTIATGHY